MKPATNVGKDVPIVVKAQEQQWASRGAHKLIGALDAFEPAGLTVAGRRCLDAGASTGASRTCCWTAVRRVSQPWTSGTGN